MRRFIGIILLSVAAVASIGTLPASASNAPARTVQRTFHRTQVHGTNETAVTALSLRPDSGFNGSYWADDDFSRSVNVQRQALVPGTFCGLVATHACYRWLAVFNDLKGMFQTIPGVASPGLDNLTLGVAERGSFSGTQEEVIYDTYGNAFPGDVPTAENDNGALNGTSSTNWPCQFFGNQGFCHPQGAETFSYSYAVAAGADAQCATKSWHWVDATKGDVAGTGDILAPTKATCPATPST